MLGAGGMGKIEMVEIGTAAVVVFDPDKGLGEELGGAIVGWPAIEA